MEHFARHNLLWKLVWWPFWLWSRIRLNYRPRTQDVPTPSLIVSNHCTDLDPLLLGLTVKRHTYFIASEHVFHHRFAGPLLMWLQAPIVRLKGSSGGDAALAAIRRMRAGRSVAVFAEGNRTFNGVTADIVESTAKLARVSGASLVTHRFRGGYFTSPRWSGSSLRRGRLTGEVVRIYTPAELKAMKPAEIADAIRKDIHEDAYATQAEWQVPYKGRRLAEHLDRALCVCPKCGALGMLRSENDRLTCTGCGLSARYTPLGYLEGEDLPFHTVTDWDRWQAEQLRARTEADGPEDPIAEDDGIELCESTEEAQDAVLAAGTLRIFRDRMECADHVLPFSDISAINLTGPQALVFTLRDRHFTLRSGQIRNLRKHLTIYYAATDPGRILSL